MQSLELYNEYKNKKVDWGFKELSEFVFDRTYSRYKDDNTKETYQDTLFRVVSNLFKYINEDQENQIKQTKEQMFKYLFDIKFLCSGRSLWALDKKIIDKTKGISLNSCSYFSFNEDHPVNVFCNIMNVLMLGCGSAFDSWTNETYYINKPNIKEQEILLIPDSRDGWVFSLRLLLSSYLFQDRNYIKFNYCDIRPKGQKLKTFGGYSAGSKPLKECHEAIRNILDENIYKKLNSKIITDICCIIARMVVSGNIRRSALLALGKDDDDIFLDLKDYDKNKDRINYGYCSNNSILIDNDLDDYYDIIKRIKKNGEPGLVFINNIKRFGRMAYHADNKDYDDNIGINACGEISLNGRGEFCNLSEVFLNRIDNKDEFLDVIKYAFLFCKIISTIKTGIKKSDEIIEKNRRIGVSLSGIIQFIDKYDKETLIDWLKDGYDTLKEYDKQISKILGINESIKITCCKPSGTLSLLAGAIPSIMRPYYRKYIRRVRISKDDQLIDKYKNLGYEIEDDVICSENKIIKFIIDLGNIQLNTHNIEDDLELASILQGYWADNNISMTVQFNNDIDDNIFNDIIKKYSKKLKTLCFLPRDCKYYPQMPYEELTDDQYEEEMNNINKRKNLNQSRYNWFNNEDRNDFHEEKELNIYCDSLSCLNI